MKVLLITFLLFSLFSFGQSIENHQWKHRVLLIYSSDEKSVEMKNQWKLLSSKKKELLERKLLIYSFTKDTFRFHFNEKRQPSKDLYEKYKNQLNNFSVMLLGLDGGIKLSQTEILSTEKLFAIIDGMPMRKRELKSKKKL